MHEFWDTIGGFLLALGLILWRVIKAPFRVARHIMTAPYNLSPQQLKWSVRAALLVAVGLIVGVIVLTERIAEKMVSPDSPLWDAVLQARAGLPRLVLAPPLPVLAGIIAVWIFLVLENTELGKRYLRWALDTDSEAVKAAKTRNAGTILATLLGACILGTFLGVLR